MPIFSSFWHSLRLEKWLMKHGNIFSHFRLEILQLSFLVWRSDILQSIFKTEDIHNLKYFSPSQKMSFNNCFERIFTFANLFEHPKKYLR